MAEGPVKPPSEGKSGMQMWGSFAGMGFEFLAAMVLPGALGYWLDGKFDSQPWLMLLGGAFGFGVGLYRMLKTVNQVMR